MILAAFPVIEDRGRKYKSVDDEKVIINRDL